MRRISSLFLGSASGLAVGLLLSTSGCGADDSAGPASLGSGGGGNQRAAGSVSGQPSSGGASNSGASGSVIGGPSGGASGSGGSSGGALGGGGTESTGGGQDASTDATRDATAPVDAVPEVHLTDAGAYVRTGWTAVGTPPTPPAGMRNPDTKENLSADNAFDGKLNTRWGTGLYQTASGQLPETFTVDMKAPVTFRRITLDPGSADEVDYPASCDVYVSNDPASFGNAILTGHVGKANLDTITLPQAVTAQYIRLINNKANPNHWWAIAEMNVYP